MPGAGGNCPATGARESTGLRGAPATTWAGQSRQRVNELSASPATDNYRMSAAARPAGSGRGTRCRPVRPTTASKLLATVRGLLLLLLLPVAVVLGCREDTVGGTDDDRLR